MNPQFYRFDPSLVLLLNTEAETRQYIFLFAQQFNKNELFLYTTHYNTMTKKFLLTILLLTPIAISAQVTYQPPTDPDAFESSMDLSKMSFGIRITPSVSWLNITNPDMQPDGAALKLSLGGVINYTLADHIALVSGLNYNYYGGYAYDNRSLNAKDTLSAFKLDFREVEIPLMLKLKTKPVNKLSYYLLAGITAGFILGADEIRTPSDKSYKPATTDMSYAIVPTRLNYIIGAGMDHYIGNKSYLFASVSYKKTINNVTYSTVYSQNRYSTPVQIYPANMEFSIGIMF